MPTPVAVRRALLALFAGLSLIVVAPAAPADAALGQRTLAQGDRGGDVRDLQRLLRRAGFPQRVDGVFGRRTFLAVRLMERELGVRVDGRFSRTDLRRLRTALAPAEGTGGFSIADVEAAERRPRAVSSQESPGAKSHLTPDGLAISPAYAL